MEVNGMSPVRQGDKTAEKQWLEDQLGLIAEGKKEALAFLYQKTQASVYAFLLSYLPRHDAEDAVQETYIQIFQSAGKYVSHGKPMGWILGIAKNIALMKLRSGRRELTLPEENWSLMEDELQGLSFEDRSILHSMMKKLTQEEYRIIVLHVATGLKFREIGTLLKLPLSTTLSKYHRAMKRMKEAWKEESGHE